MTRDWGNEAMEALVDAKWDLFCSLRLNEESKEFKQNVELSDEQVKRLLGALKTINAVLDEKMTPELKAMTSERSPKCYTGKRNGKD